MLCVADLREIFYKDLQGKICGVVLDAHYLSSRIMPGINGSSGFSLNTDTYFNAGLILIDLEKYRNNNIEQKCFEWLLHYTPIWHDQDTLNAVLSEHICVLPLEWNFMIGHLENKAKSDFKGESKKFSLNYTYKEYIKAKSKIKILHYLTPTKPWHALKIDDNLEIISCAYSNEWWIQACKTPIFDKELQILYIQRQEATFYNLSICLQQIVNMLKLQEDSKKAKVVMDNKQELNIKQDSKQDEIINMFNDIAKTYDTTNRVMSMGIDISWRKEACKEAFRILNKQTIDIADIACGTGDMMLHWQQSSKDLGIEIASIEGIDPSSGMLEQAKQKIPQGVFKIAQANNLPLESCSKDIISIAYGLRNVVEREAALKEFYRVLRPNGVLVILEFTMTNKQGFFSKLMQFYTRNILPIVGGLVSRNFKAYRYLPDSIDKFITCETLKSELLAHNMTTIFLKSYSANISSLLIAQK